MWLACLNLSGVVSGSFPSAAMRVAPDGPKKWLGFESRFLCQVVREADVPFTSSNFCDREIRWIDFGKAVTGIGRSHRHDSRSRIESRVLSRQRPVYLRGHTLRR